MPDTPHQSQQAGHGKSKRSWRYNPVELRVDAPDCFRFAMALEEAGYAPFIVSEPADAAPLGEDVPSGIATIGGGTRSISLFGMETEAKYDPLFALDFDIVLIDSVGADAVPDDASDEDETVALPPELIDQLEAAVARPLYGLVLTGGKSKRMGQDKALIELGGETQLDRAGRLLGSVCDQVYVSARGDQSDRDDCPWPVIADSFLDIGPMAGILSAQRAHPDAAWLVMACDLPYVTAETLAALVGGRDPFRYATAFQSSSCEFPEPLCAIWEPKSHQRMLHFLGLGYGCPRKVLINSRIQLLQQENPQWLDNVNTPDDLDAARRDLA